ncbi:MAG: sulfite exporter TauE/SafE family protein [Cyclobacteriaceae bacterium]
MTIILFVLLFLLGVATGFYSGLLGTGGNIILIPALDLLFVYYGISGTESVKLIIANSLFVTVFLGAVITLKQHRIGNFHLREILSIGIPGMISAYAMSEWINSSNWFDKFYFDIIFLTLLILLAVRLLFFKTIERKWEENEKSDFNYGAFMGVGLLTGCVTSLSGLGGGIVLIPFLTDIMKEPVKKASSVSIGVIMLLAISVTASYLFVNDGQQVEAKLPMQIGYISILTIAPILAGILMASSYGVKVAHKTSPLKLRIIFGIIVTLLCIKVAWSLFIQ